MALHTFTVCDLADGAWCDATTVSGGGRVFMFSNLRFYLGQQLVARSIERERSQSFAMPLDVERSIASPGPGRPVLLSRVGRSSECLVRSDSAGDGMWGAEVAAGRLRYACATFQVSLTARRASSSYRRLAKPEGYGQNRFVERYLHAQVALRMPEPRQPSLHGPMAGVLRMTFRWYMELTELSRWAQTR